MTRALSRLLRRLLVLAIGAFTVWLIVFVIFRFADHQLPWVVAVALTYIIAAYVVLPRAVRMSLKVLQRKHVPRYTITGDGLPGDPVNLVLRGTRAQLDAAFAAAGWRTADRLTLLSSWRMVRAFLFNVPTPPRRSARFIFTAAARTSAFRRPSITIRASAIMCAFGP
jgi:hypothetical protein